MTKRATRSIPGHTPHPWNQLPMKLVWCDIYRDGGSYGAVVADGERRTALFLEIHRQHRSHVFHSYGALWVAEGELPSVGTHRVATHAVAERDWLEVLLKLDTSDATQNSRDLLARMIAAMSSAPRFDEPSGHSTEIALGTQSVVLLEMIDATLTRLSSEICRIWQGRAWSLRYQAYHFQVHVASTQPKLYISTNSNSSRAQRVLNRLATEIVAVVEDYSSTIWE